jgi:hypothetical protein
VTKKWLNSSVKTSGLPLKPSRLLYKFLQKAWGGEERKNNAMKNDLIFNSADFWTLRSPYWSKNFVYSQIVLIFGVEWPGCLLLLFWGGEIDLGPEKKLSFCKDGNIISDVWIPHHFFKSYPQNPEFLQFANKFPLGCKEKSIALENKEWKLWKKKSFWNNAALLNLS